MELESSPRHPFSSTLVIPFPETDFGIPSRLGNFRLDKHNVEEWTDPSCRHRSRTEIGKWVNTEQKADIQIQRRDDATKSAKGQENQRSEIIQGTSPHTQFEIVRTERSVKDDPMTEHGHGHGQDSSRISSTSTSSSTSYQMSSSRGIKFTSKSTSNKTTTTTSTTLETKPDAFEGLKIESHLLDSSTQRERITAGRSGTMGVRRPPTRKPIRADDPKPPESPDSTNTDLRSGSPVKTISPKILVGFPAEIQVELKTRLTGHDVNEESGGRRVSTIFGKSNGSDFLPSLPKSLSVKPDTTTVPPRSFDLMQRFEQRHFKESSSGRTLTTVEAEEAEPIDFIDPDFFPETDNRSSSPMNKWSDDTDTLSLYPFTARNFEEAENERYFNGAGILSTVGINSLGRYTNHRPDLVHPDPCTKVSQTYISSADTGRPSRHAKDNELTTSISATVEPPKRGLRKVEFCKTEVHFTPEPGKFHIVESDENKPSTVHLFRRRKRKTSLDANNPVSSETRAETPITPVTSIVPGISLWGHDTLEEPDPDDESLPKSYDELKISKYLNQLRSLTTVGGRDTNYAHNEFIVDQLRAEYANEGGGDEEDELHFCYGSFVPLATRQNLIEMNNRNRMKFQSVATMSSQASDLSSSTSTYSLPNSDSFEPLIKPALTNLYELPADTDFTELGSRTDRFKSSYDMGTSRMNQIPAAVLPYDIHNSRNGRRSYSASPIRDSEKRKAKPPTPIFPVHFSALEKTGEALRSRAAAKVVRCACVKKEEEPTVPLTTVVKIVNDEPNPVRNPVDIRSSLAFQKLRSEPEWVSTARAKAKSRESGGIEWSQIGQRPLTTTAELKSPDPPWISELMVRNRTSSVKESGTVHTWQEPSTPAFPEGPKSEEIPVVPEITLASTPSLNNNRSIVDLNRDSESIIINPNQIDLADQSKVKGQPHKTRGGGASRRNTPVSSDKPQSKPLSEKKTSGSLNRKPLQTSTSSNRSVTALEPERKAVERGEPSRDRQKPKTPPKPPAPPQRISSLLKPPTILNTNASLDKKKKSIPPKKQGEVAEAGRVVHRHPTVKVSKLPLRNGPSSPSPDTMEPLRKKSHVSLLSEAKSVGRGKPIKVDTRRPTSRSPIPTVTSASPQQRKR